jgi:hypothetical protein
MLPHQARAELFRRIKTATTIEEAQLVALRMWHDMNATQEGFICPGCANCAFSEECAVPPPTPAEPDH